MAKDLAALADQLEILLKDPKVRARLSPAELAARTAQIATMRANAQKTAVAKPAPGRSAQIGKPAPVPVAAAAPVAPAPVAPVPVAVAPPPPAPPPPPYELFGTEPQPELPMVLRAFANPQALVAGIVFSEVLAPPVSLRPRD